MSREHNATVYPQMSKGALSIVGCRQSVRGNGRGALVATHTQAMIIDWRAIARRIRGLANLSDAKVLAKTAARLGVSEQELTETIEAESPTSAVKVIRAAVRVYGLDPSWIIGGRYDAGTHRAAMQPDSAAFEEVMSRLLGEPRRQPAVDLQADDRPGA